MSTLSTDELLALAQRLAADPSVWEPHVRLDAERRACHPLVRSAEATIWLLCWTPGQETGFHDHDGAAGAVAVVRGSVVEQRLRLGGSPSEREVGMGGSFAFEGWAIHNVRHGSGEPAVTIHAYSPALRRMGAYDFGPDGELRRRALDEEVELGDERPLVLSL